MVEFKMVQFLLDDVVFVTVRGALSEWKVSRSEDVDGNQDTDQVGPTTSMELVPRWSKDTRRGPVLSWEDKGWYVSIGGGAFVEGADATVEPLARA